MTFNRVAMLHVQKFKKNSFAKEERPVINQQPQKSPQSFQVLLDMSGRQDE
jgi:hypothetical protein